MSITIVPFIINQKMVFANFTCVVTRFVSIEIATHPDVESPLLALGQFLKRRKSELVLSDNFKTFKLGKVINFLRNNNIK